MLFLKRQLNLLYSAQRNVDITMKRCFLKIIINPQSTTDVKGAIPPPHSKKTLTWRTAPVALWDAISCGWSPFGDNMHCSFQFEGWVILFSKGQAADYLEGGFLDPTLLTLISHMAGSCYEVFVSVSIQNFWSSEQYKKRPHNNQIMREHKYPKIIKNEKCNKKSKGPQHHEHSSKDTHISKQKGGLNLLRKG